SAITLGNKEARAKLTSGDEMQELGDAFDRMMDERGRFMQTEAENERLNNSIIAILRSVSQLGKGDLTVRVPVHEDVTGALGDAINHMSESIGTGGADVETNARFDRAEPRDGPRYGAGHESAAGHDPGDGETHQAPRRALSGNRRYRKADRYHRRAYEHARAERQHAGGPGG